jgi:TPR repeat protein
MRPYVRPLVVTFSALGLACLFSYAAILLTEPAEEAKNKPSAPPFGSNPNRHARLNHAAAKEIREADGTTAEPTEAEKQIRQRSGMPFCGEGLRTRSDTRDSADVKNIEAFKNACNDAFGGDPRKLMALAEFYQKGIGTQKDEMEATRIHWIGAEKGDAECQFVFGRELMEGTGVKKDTAAGIAWLRKAADQKLAAAEYLLHKTYAAGTEVPADLSESRKWLLRAAEHGHPDARADLAEEILHAKDRKSAKSVITWVSPGALAGHGRSCYIMGFVHSVGFGVKADPVEAMAWRLICLTLDSEVDPRPWRIDYEGLGEVDQAKAEQRAKELSGTRKYQSPFLPAPEELAAAKQEFEATKTLAEQGDAVARHHLAKLYESGRGTRQDMTAAARWCRLSALQGYAAAQYSLGVMLSAGDAVAPDKEEAFAWHMKAALQGNVDAEYALSVCYQEGEGVPVDKKAAMHWRRLAAEHGDAYAQSNLGKNYFGDEPDAGNDAIAARWFRKSAEQLHAEGGFWLGICYLSGRGVTQDKIEGIAWMMTSGDDLKPDGKSALIRILKDFTDDELSRGNERSKQLVKECRAKLEAAEAKASR